MLEIDLEKLEDWIKDRFPDFKKPKSDYLVNTPFKEDRKHKLSISPEKRCFHCWKTDASGPIYALVMELEGCSKKEALELVYQKNTVQDFDKQMNQLRNGKEQNSVETVKTKIALPESFQYISFESMDQVNLRALEYCIKERQINPIKWHFGFCNSGAYQNRLVIPFFDREGEIYYWIARTLNGSELRYLNPSVKSKEDVKKEDVMFIPKWNIKGKDVLVVEGALDAIVLSELGFMVVALQGKTLSPYHIEALKESRIILGLDNDQPGREALLWNMKVLKEHGIDNVRYVFSPKKDQDWNKCYLEMGDGLKDAILKGIKTLAFKDLVKFSMQKCR
jgi:DNA primase